MVSCFCQLDLFFSDWFWLLVKLLLLFLSYLQAWVLTPLVLLGYLVGAELFYSIIIIMGDTKDLQDSLFFGSMTSTKLKGSNYLQWSRAVLVFLTALIPCRNNLLNIFGILFFSLGDRLYRVQ